MSLQNIGRVDLSQNAASLYNGLCQITRHYFLISEPERAAASGQGAGDVGDEELIRQSTRRIRCLRLPNPLEDGFNSFTGWLPTLNIPLSSNNEQICAFRLDEEVKVLAVLTWCVDLFKHRDCNSDGCIGQVLPSMMGTSKSPSNS